MSNRTGLTTGFDGEVFREPVSEMQAKLNKQVLGEGWDRAGERAEDDD